MRTYISYKALTFFATILIFASSFSQTKKYDYPQIKKMTVVEDYCGQEVVDDYRNLENLKDSSVVKWFKKQESFANNMFNNIKGRDLIFNELKEYATRNEFETWRVKVLENGSHFYFKEYAQDYTPSIYLKKDKSSTETLLFDPKTYRPEDNKKYTVRDFKPSWDGTKIAIALTYSGREFSEILIIDVANKEIMVEGIENCWSDLIWLPDNSGITYMALSDDFEESEDHFKNMNVSLYKLGDPAQETRIAFSQESFPELNMTDSDIPNLQFDYQDDRYAIGWISGATAYHDAYYCSSNSLFNDGKINWRPLCKKENKVEKVSIDRENLIVLTAEKNENFLILQTPLENIDWENMEVLVSPAEGEVIKDFEITSNGIFYTTSINGVAFKLYHYDKGISKEIPLPIDAGYANINSISPKNPELWLRTMGWLRDYERYLYNFETDTFNSENLSPPAEYPEFKDLAIKEVEATAHDGEKIPLSIIYRKDMKMDGSNPTLMYGYGSYGISYEPFFLPSWLLWVEMGGVLAIAHVRGGGEKGNAWYEGGKKKNKPNTWKDMNSCTEFMIDQGYTSKGKTIVQGGSAGGILVGRAITERPDLYAVAITRVGAMNVLRSEDAPNGANNVKEFGSYNNPDECEALLKMDAYTHIGENVSYPATLITAGLNDPRIVAWSPGKFAARLQERNISNKPIVFYAKTDSGHGLGESKWSHLEEIANLYAFAFWQVGKQGFQIKKGK